MPLHKQPPLSPLPSIPNPKRKNNSIPFHSNPIPNTTNTTIQTPHFPIQNQETGKKMKFPFLFKSPAEESASPAAAAATSWPWPSCGHHKTLSFRSPGGDIFKTINSAYDTTEEEPEPDPTAAAVEDPVEAVISGLRAAPERLFFEPGETSSILGESKSSNAEEGQFGDQEKEEEEEEASCSTELVAIDSTDPYVDFKRSMEEMVEAHGLKDWAGLEELLGWYLKANGKENHGYILRAFVDLLVGLSTFTTTTSSSSSSSSSLSSDRDRSFSVVASTACSLNSPLSISSSTCAFTPCLSLLEAEDEIHKTVDSNPC